MGNCCSGDLVRRDDSEQKAEPYNAVAGGGGGTKGISKSEELRLADLAAAQQHHTRDDESESDDGFVNAQVSGAPRRGKIVASPTPAAISAAYARQSAAATAEWIGRGKNLKMTPGRGYPKPLPVTATSVGDVNFWYQTADLPSFTRVGWVRHVYDGDTFTLSDDNRVRLLGIDAPEIKEQQPYAPESRDFVKDLVMGRPVFMYQIAAEPVDHYGRLIALVFVYDEQKRMFLCVNDAVLAMGLGGFYEPGKEPNPMRERMLRLQSGAMRRGGNIWRGFHEATVYATRNGKAFHSQDCMHVAHFRTQPMLKSAALERGLSGCRTCQS